MSKWRLKPLNTGVGGEWTLDKDEILALREAYMKKNNHCMQERCCADPCVAVQQRAEDLYPMPPAPRTVTRPRVYVESGEELNSGGGGREWRVFGGQIQTRAPLFEKEWVCAENSVFAAHNFPNGAVFTPKRVRALVDLLDRPDETVEVDE